jgi:hypothetical protein
MSGHKEYFIDVLDWISTRFVPIGYYWQDTENNNKEYTSEEILDLYEKEND